MRYMIYPNRRVCVFPPYREHIGWSGGIILMLTPEFMDELVSKGINPEEYELQKFDMPSCTTLDKLTVGTKLRLQLPEDINDL